MVSYNEYKQKLNKLRVLEEQREALYGNMRVFAAREDNPVMTINLKNPVETTMNEAFEASRKKREAVCAEIKKLQREIGSDVMEATKEFDRRFRKNVFSGMNELDTVAMGELRAIMGNIAYKRAVAGAKIRYIEMDASGANAVTNRREQFDSFEGLMRNNSNRYSGSGL